MIFTGNAFIQSASRYGIGTIDTPYFADRFFNNTNPFDPVVQLIHEGFHLMSRVMFLNANFNGISDSALRKAAGIALSSLSDSDAFERELETHCK